MRHKVNTFQDKINNPQRNTRNANQIISKLSCILLDFKNILLYNLKCHYLSSDNNINMSSIVCVKNTLYSFCIKLKDSFKKVISTVLSISILYTQLFFSFLTTQAIISVISANSVHAKTYSGFSRDPNREGSRRIRQGEGSSSQYTPQNPYQNIKDNPINNIIIDEAMCNGGYDDLGNCNGGTALDRTQNGTPMVNINNATEGGVSANYYKKLDVNQENLILNNYKGEAVNTALGGVIYGNPNMNGANGRMADIILNEITSNQQTNINGYIEVAGKKADVIIANPNGIMVSGGGFINTARLSMITGSSLNSQTNSSLDANGNLNPFQLSTNPNAVINVIGKNITNEKGDIVGYNIGIDAQNTDYLTLISRVANISGDIIGSTDTSVEIKTGNDKAIFNKQTGEFDVNSDDAITKGKPQFAFDSTAMGGIYAGKVSIVATEHGVGVRTRGDVVAYVDDIEFDVNGNIIFQDANLQTLDQTKQINIKNRNNNPTAEDIKLNQDQYTTTLDNSNIYGGNVNIETDNLENKNSSVIYGIEETHVEATNNINNTSKIYANNLVRLKSDTLSNIDGEITAWNDINIELLSNFITEGLIGSTWGTTTIAAENITIDNDKSKENELTGYNIILKSRNDITNTFTSSLVAENDIIFDALLAVYNHGTVSAGNNLEITAGERIMNYGALQALGSDHLTTEKTSEPYLNELGEQITDKDGNPVYIQRGGVLKLTTKAAINEDYQLNDLTAKSQNNSDIDNNKPLPLPTETLEQLNKLDTITDTKELQDLLAITLNTRNENEYEAVQKRIRSLKIKEIIESAKEDFVFDKNNFTIGSVIAIEDEDEYGNITYNNHTLTEDDIQETLQDLLKDNYKESDWKIDTSKLNAEINTEVQTKLNEELNKYNEQQREADPDNYEDLSLQDFLQLPQNSTLESDIETATNRTARLEAEAKKQETDRLAVIENIYTQIQSNLNTLESKNWSTMDEKDEFEFYLKSLHNTIGQSSSLNMDNWTLQEIQTTSEPLDDYTKYLMLTRLDNLNQESVEKTGIHNYGRLFANTDMTITSNSVFHNNKDSLILANRNITFNVADIIFNNAGGIQDYGTQASIGYGIISKGDITIRGVSGATTSRLDRLINYDGRIEADYDINIRTNETINYGSDSCNYFANPNCAIERYWVGHEDGYDRRHMVKVYGETKNRSILLSNQSQIVSNYGNIDIDSTKRITNYNSVIYGKNSITLKTDELFNTIAEFTATDLVHLRRKWKKPRKGKIYTDYYPDQQYLVLLKSNNAQSRIVSQGSVVINADTTNNGRNIKIELKEENIEIAKIPYASKPTDNQSLLGKVIDTGKLDLLDAIKLPTNNHGIFKKTDDPKSKYLYETDPLLIDVSRFLGSQYFLNRIGLDPFSIDQKFLGDAYMEHQMIKTYLEQIGFFQNNKISDAEIDEYISNLYNTLDPDKIKEIEQASGQSLELGKELTKEQIANLKEDIVWYVSKTITTPDGETMEVLVPQVYLAQESVNKLLANSNNHAELQAELSIKQATDKAVQTSTDAGNNAISTELEKISTQAKTEAKNSITNQDKSTATQNTEALIQNNKEDYDTLVQKYLDSLKQEATSSSASISVTLGNKDTGLYYYVDPDAKSSCKTGIACRTSFTTLTEAQALELAKQKAYNEIYNSELNKIETTYYNQIYKEKSTIFMENNGEKIFQTAYDKTYQSAYDTAYTAVQSQNSAKMNTDTMIAGDNVAIQGKNPNTTVSTLNNSGTIWGNRQVVITTDQINNATAALNKDGNTAPQATIMGGDLVYLNTIQYKTDEKGNYQLDKNGNKIALSTGQVNNISGMIGSFNSNSTTYIETGTLNNITNSQREDYSASNRRSSYEETRTYLGTTSQIASNGNLIIDATNDINLIGSSLLAKNNAQITAGRNFNSTTVEDYNRTFNQSESKSTLTTINQTYETASLKNLKSSVYAGDNMTIIAGNDITSIGTNFGATNGDINLIAENNLTLANAMDWDYSYSFYQKQSIDLATVAVSTFAGAITSGPLGMYAGAYNGTQAKVGRTDMTEDYRETASKTTLNAGGNINLQSGKDITLISADLSAGQDIYSYSGGQTFIGTAVENSYHNEFHETNKRNLLGAAVGGIIAGKAAVIGGIAGPVGSVYMVDKASDMTAGISTNTKISESGWNNQINNASNLNAGGTITNIAKDSLTIAGSNLYSENGGITLASLNSNVNILDVKDTYSDYSREYSKGFDKVFVEFDQQLTAGVQYNESEEKTQSNSSISMGSNISSNNGNINIIANHSKEDGNTGNILQVGSNVYSDNGNINYQANNGDILLLAGQNTHSANSQYDQTTITAGVKVGNSFVDAGYAVDGLVDATNAVKDAKDELSRMKELRDQGKASDQAVKDAEYNLAMATANLVNATVQLASAAKSAFASTATAGFYAGVYMNYDTMSTTTNDQSTWHSASNVMANNGNITFNSDNDMLQHGSNVLAQNGTATYNIANDLTIKATQDTFLSEMKSENKSVNIEVSSTGGSAGGGKGESSSRTMGTTNQNATTTANNIIFNVGNDATFSGANILASTRTTIDENGNEIKIGGNLIGNIGNNLIVESLQDTFYSKSNSNSMNASVGTSSVGGGFSKNKSYTDSQWVNNQTTMIGEGSVALNVGTKEGSEGKTTITDALIAAGSYNEDGIFVDNGNLTLNTKDLAYSNLNDFFTTESKGFGFQTSIGHNVDQGKANVSPIGSTTVTLLSTGEDREQETRATIGNGIITTGITSYIRDEDGNIIGTTGGAIQTELAGLNRDINQSQEITKDMITGALDGSFTIDNRLIAGFMTVGQTAKLDDKGNKIPELDADGNQKLDKDGNPVFQMRDVSGWESLGSDLKGMPVNLIGATLGAGGSIYAGAKTGLQLLFSSSTGLFTNTTDENNKTTGIADLWQANQESMTKGLFTGVDKISKAVAKKNNNGEATDEELQYLAGRNGVNIYTSEGKEIIGTDGEGNTGQVEGLYDGTTKKAFVDAYATQGNSKKLLMNIFEEGAAHPYTENETLAKSAAKDGVFFFNLASLLTGGGAIATDGKAYGGMGVQAGTTLVGQNGLTAQQQMQQNWNNKYNTNTSSLLRQNTQQAMQSMQNTNMFSVFVNSQNKIVKVVDDGDYNAYRVKDDVTREDIEIMDSEAKGLGIENLFKYDEDGESTRIAYMEFMGSEDLRLDNILSDEKYSIDNILKDPTSLEQYVNALNTYANKEKLFNNKEVHDDFLLLDGFDKNKSLIDNAFLSDNVNQNAYANIFKIMDSGIKIDDYTLSGILTPNLYNALANANYTGGAGNNPTKNIANTFNFTINNVYTAIPVIGGEARGSTGCGTNNCGDLGSGRKQGARPHFGTDVLGDIGAWVIAGRDGKIEYASSYDSETKVSLPAINLYTKDGIIQTLYTQYNIREGTKVKQGDIIGNIVDLKRNPSYSTTINHTHIEMFERYVSPTSKVKVNRQDSNQILVPNRENPFGMTKIQEYLEKQKKGK